jgi:PhnB protein
MATNKVKPIPDGYHTITPYIVVNDGVRAIDFYQKAFGAEVLYKMVGPNGKVMHAELKIGDSPFMLGDEMPEMGVKSKKTIGGCPIGLYIYVTDVDARIKTAVDAGGKLTKPVKDQFYGDRSGAVEDPCGYEWTFATHVEDVSHEEVQKRAAAAHGGC